MYSWDVRDSDQQRTKGVSHKVRLHVANFAPVRVSPRIRQSASTSIVYPRVRPHAVFYLSTEMIDTIHRLLENTTFRVESRPDFSCYLFDENWRRFAEFRGNPSCIVPRRHSR